MSEPAFVPERPSVISIAGDGTLAALTEPQRIVIVGLPSLAAITEIGVDGEASANEAMWVGSPPRLLVLSRYAAHSSMHLLDPASPAGPRTLAEIRLETPMKLMAANGAYALVVGSMGSAIVVAGAAHLTPYQFPARGVPTAAGAAAAQFVAALGGSGGSIEEWDPQSRMPKRRFRLPRPAVIKAVGGSERIVWMTTQADPTRVECLPLVNRGQPKQHDLPEPIARVAAHPRSDLVACVGADTGRVFVVDLDGRARMRTLALAGEMRAEHVALVQARGIAALVAQAGRPLALIALDSRDGEVEMVGNAARATESAAATPAKPPAWTTGIGAALEGKIRGVDAPAGSTLGSHDDPDDAAAAPVASMLAPAEPVASPPPPSPPPPPSTITQALRTFGAPVPTAAPTAPTLTTAIVRAPVPPVQMSALPRGTAPAIASAAPQPSLTERFSQWRDRAREGKPRAAVIAEVGWADPGTSWRDELATWTRSVMSGAVEGDPPAAELVERMLARFELPAELGPAVALLYGAHLCGERGVAPVEVARVLARRWDEALGRGILAARGIAVYADSRVRLAAPVIRALDERPPATGTLVGDPGEPALLGPCVVVAPADGDRALAETYLPSVGAAILIAADHAEPRELFIEARAFGAVPLLHVDAHHAGGLPADPAILVVADEAAADALGVPRLA